MRLTWRHPGHLTLTHWDYDTATATIRVPVTTSGDGRPPAISFSPRYLADALVIGSTLRFVDGMTPAVATDPSSGNYCLIMPCRFTEEAEATEDGAETETKTKTEAVTPAGGNAPVPAPAIAA